MSRLQSVTVGKNVTKIGARAFEGDKQLKRVSIKGKNLKKVGAAAFANIHKKAKIKVPQKKLGSYKKLLNGKTKAAVVK